MIHRKIKSVLIYGFTLAIALSFTPFFSLEAQTPCPEGKYCALSTIPGTTVAGQEADPVKIVRNIYGISIAIAAILAIGMIIWAGIQYATAEAITGKSDAKKHWQGAIGGLLLLISSYLILRTINVDLVNIDLGLGTPQACVDANGLPCGASNGLPIVQERTRLASVIEQQEATLTARNTEVTQKQSELEKAIAEENTKTNPDTARLERIDGELQQLINLRDQAQNSIQKSTGTYSAVVLAGNGLAMFEEAKKESKYDQMRSSAQTFQEITRLAISGMETAKYSNDTPVFTPQEIEKARAEFNEQLTYMNSYVEWRTEGNNQTNLYANYAVGTNSSARTEPTQPTFELGF